MIIIIQLKTTQFLKKLTNDFQYWLEELPIPLFKVYLEICNRYPNITEKEYEILILISTKIYITEIDIKEIEITKKLIEFVVPKFVTGILVHHANKKGWVEIFGRLTISDDCDVKITEKGSEIFK